MANDKVSTFQLTELERKAIVKALEVHRASYARAAKAETDESVAALRVASVQGCDVLIAKFR